MRETQKTRDLSGGLKVVFLPTLEMKKCTFGTPPTLCVCINFGHSVVFEAREYS